MSTALAWGLFMFIGFIIGAGILLAGSFFRDVRSG